MSYPKLNDEEIIQRDKELYEKYIRAKVETVENIGKLISINVETCEYEIGEAVRSSPKARANTNSRNY